MMTVDDGESKNQCGSKEIRIRLRRTLWECLVSNADVDVGVDETVLGRVWRLTSHATQNAQNNA